MAGIIDNQKKLGTSTNLIISGRPKAGTAYTVNHSVERASTVLFKSYTDFAQRDRPFFYGRFGTSSHRALEESIASLEHAQHVCLAPSGLCAITLCMTALAYPGGHVLVTDSAYDPTRAYCDGLLKRMGVTTEYYDPRISGAELGKLLRDNTAFVFCESPGSLTFEIQDIPALIGAAHQKSVPVLVDNTWASSYFFKPLCVGADISIMSATKYLCGGSDVLMGTVAVNDTALFKRITSTSQHLGLNVSADDAYLMHRGVRTLPTRLRQHEHSGLCIAEFLAGRPEIQQVLHPGLAGHPDFSLWQRDFTGASGLFSAILRPISQKALAAFCDSLRLFGMGYSWGGYESLCLPIWPERYRTAVPWRAEGPCLRFNIGLEDVADLKNDLEAGFAAMHAAETQ